MNLNTIELPAAVIADLYGSSLIEPAVISREEAPGHAIKITGENTGNTFLGNNRQQVLVVVDHKEVVHIPDNELLLLTGILSACKLGMEDIALINRNNYPGKTYKELNQQFKPRTVLLFDTAPETIDLPLHFPHFQPQSFNGITYLFSPALKEMEKDKVVKSKLWLCLKKIFNL